MGRPKVFADGPSILKYIKPLTNIRYAIISSTSSALSYNFDTKKLWTVTTVNTATAEETVYTCQFIFSCSGYYNYTKGYTPNLRIKPALKEK
jgi:cation diffusion facilitator CzcD-associated flavoprotein CzcO